MKFVSIIEPDINFHKPIQLDQLIGAAKKWMSNARTK